MKIIIVGCGRTGIYMANELVQKGHEVTLVDINSAAFDKMDKNLPVRRIIGTGIDEDVLIRAGIKEADALFALTKGDNTNAMIGQIAKFIYKIPKVIVRMADYQSKQFYEEYLDLSCYCPSVISAQNYLEFLGETQY